MRPRDSIGSDRKQHPQTYELPGSIPYMSALSYRHESCTGNLIKRHVSQSLNVLFHLARQGFVKLVRMNELAS